MKPIVFFYCILSFLIFSCKEKIEETASKNQFLIAEDLEEAVNIYEKFWNSNDPEVLTPILSENFKRYANGKLEAESHEELINILNNWHLAIPDFSTKLKDIVIHGNKAYYYWESEGTNSGYLGSARGTGIESNSNGFAILTFNKQGKIVKEEAFYDSMNIYLSWGYKLVPPNKG